MVQIEREISHLSHGSFSSQLYDVSATDVTVTASTHCARLNIGTR